MGPTVEMFEMGSVIRMGKMFVMGLIILMWESAQLIETSYAMPPHLPDGFLWWILLGGSVGKFIFEGDIQIRSHTIAL